MNNIRILIAEDESWICDTIRDDAAKEKYTVDEAKNGAQALDMFLSEQYQLVILDVKLSKVDGWTVCRQIRTYSRVPIVMITEMEEEFDRLFGFELAVDDFIIMPISPKELLSRIKAILRRSLAAEIAPRHTQKFEGLEVDDVTHHVSIDGVRAVLSAKEYELLAYFLQNQNKVISREKLLNSIWGYDFAGDERTVDAHIKMLREHLGIYRKFIVMVWGSGYKFEQGGRM